VGQRRARTAETIIRLGAYSHPLADWIIAVKHQSWEEMGLELGARLGRQIRACDGKFVNPTIIVPVPMPWLRRMERGIDHARVLAEGVSAVLAAPVVPLLRRSQGETQVSRGARTLRRRVAQGVRLRGRDDPLLRVIPAPAWGRARWDPRGGLAGHRVVLIDDVLTTGATVRACLRLLRRQQPAAIDIAVVAVTEVKAEL